MHSAKTVPDLPSSGLHMEVTNTPFFPITMQSFSSSRRNFYSLPPKNSEIVKSHFAAGFLHGSRHLQSVECCGCGEPRYNIASSSLEKELIMRKRDRSAGGHQAVTARRQKLSEWHRLKLSSEKPTASSFGETSEQSQLSAVFA